MAPGDPLDDAIDAVVRAIDRIERASRAPLGSAAASTSAAPSSLEDTGLAGSPAATPGATALADRPHAAAPGADPAAGPDPLPPYAALSESLLAHGWSPPPASAGWPPSSASASSGWSPPPAAAAPTAADAPKKGKKHKKTKLGDEPVGEASIAALALQAALARREGPAELHELVGQIVTRSQQLDDHLVAAQQLRAEISELVTRLAITASLR